MNSQNKKQFKVKLKEYYDKKVKPSLDKISKLVNSISNVVVNGIGKIARRVYEFGLRHKRITLFFAILVIAQPIVYFYYPLYYATVEPGVRKYLELIRGLKPVFSLPSIPSSFILPSFPKMVERSAGVEILRGTLDVSGVMLAFFGVILSRMIEKIRTRSNLFIWGFFVFLMMASLLGAMLWSLISLSQIQLTITSPVSRELYARPIDGVISAAIIFSFFLLFIYPRIREI